MYLGLRRARRRYVGIHVGVRRTCGFLFCEVALYRNPEAPRQVTWILAQRNCAIEGSRNATEIHMRTLGCIKKRVHSAHGFASEFAPFMSESRSSATWIEEFDAWFKNGLWLQRR